LASLAAASAGEATAPGESGCPKARAGSRIGTWFRSFRWTIGRRLILAMLITVSFGVIARATQVFRENAIRTQAPVEQVTQGARQVATAASQASGAVGKVSDGSQSQLDALRQAAAALGQSAQAISSVAQGTVEASQKVRNAAERVTGGR